MSRNKLIFAAFFLLLVLLAGTLVILEEFGPRRMLSLSLTGRPGGEFVGIVTVDGVEKPISGKFPDHRAFEGYAIDFAIVPKDDDPGENIGVALAVDDKIELTVNAGGVAGWSIRPRLFGRMRGSAGIHALPTNNYPEIREKAKPR